MKIHCKAEMSLPKCANSVFVRAGFSVMGELKMTTTDISVNV